MEIGQLKYQSYNTVLQDIYNEKEVLIAAHRGQWKANIAQNSVDAAVLTQRFGAEIMELDVALTKDGHYVVFHTGKEEELFGKSFDLEEKTLEELQEIPILNGLREPGDARIQSLEEVLEGAPSDLLFQFDRGEGYFPQLFSYIDQFDEQIKQRIIIKCALNEENLSKFDDYEDYKFMCMPIMTDMDQLSLLSRFDAVNLVGLEVLAADEASSTFGPAFTQKIKQDYQLLVQLNAIILNDRRKLYAGLDDNLSLLDAPEKGWGRLMDCGADIIQTDWALPLSLYREEHLA